MPTDLTSTIPRSATAYSGLNLRLYDAFVLHFTSPRAWGCSLSDLTEMYRRHGTDDHAEIGVGSGHFVTEQTRHIDWTALSLIDPNPDALRFVSRRVSHPAVQEHVGDILDRATLPTRRFKSVAANYVLHCLAPGADVRRTAIRNLAHLTADNGVMFGATVLGAGAEHNRLGRALLRRLNHMGTFGNLGDTERALLGHLSSSFRQVQIERRRTVLLFAASEPIR